MSNMVEVTVHAGTHIDTPHHFFRDRPGIEELPDAMIGEAIVLDLTFQGKANERITPADLERAERALAEQGIHLTKGATIFLRTDWPKGHVTTDPKWWDESPCLTREAAEWLVSKQPKVLGYDFALEEKGAGIGYQKADERSSRARCRCTASSCRRSCTRSRTHQSGPDPVPGEGGRPPRQVEDGVRAGARHRPAGRVRRRPVPRRYFASTALAWRSSGRSPSAFAQSTLSRV